MFKFLRKSRNDVIGKYTEDQKNKEFKKQLIEISRRNHAEEMVRVRKEIAEAVDSRMHFVDIKCERVGYCSFVEIVTTVANEEESFVLDRHFHSSPIDVSFGQSRMATSFASLKLAVAPKSGE